MVNRFRKSVSLKKPSPDYRIIFDKKNNLGSLIKAL